MNQEYNTPGQDAQEEKLLTTEMIIDGALKTLEDLANNAKSEYIRKRAAKQLQKYKSNQEQ